MVIGRLGGTPDEISNFAEKVVLTGRARLRGAVMGAKALQLRTGGHAAAAAVPTGEAATRGVLGIRGLARRSITLRYGTYKYPLRRNESGDRAAFEGYFPVGL